MKTSLGSIPGAYIPISINIYYVNMFLFWPGFSISPVSQSVNRSFVLFFFFCLMMKKKKSATADNHHS